MASHNLVQSLNIMMDALAAISFDWDDYLSDMTDGVIAETYLPDKTKLFQWIDIWNAQTEKMHEGDFPTVKPCIYIEVDLGDGTNLPSAITLYSDVRIKFHIVDWQIDGSVQAGGLVGTNNRIAGLGTNLEIFKWRDMVKAAMDKYRAGNFGTMAVIKDFQDFNHTGIYHYVIEFKTSFSDLKGSYYDPEQTKWVVREPPLDARLSIAFVDATPQVATIQFWKVCAIQVQVVAVPDGTTQTLDNGAVIPLQYALNMDGTLTIPYLQTNIGISVLTPFIIDNQVIQDEPYSDGTFDNSIYGGFVIGNIISFNASLPT